MEFMDIQKHLDTIIAYNELLYDMGLMDTIYDKFVIACTKCDDQHDIVMLSTLLYMMILVHIKNKDFALHLSRLDPPIDCFLFKIISQVSDMKRFALPLKKLLLLLWKVFLTIYGGQEQLQSLKNQTRQSWGLQPLTKSYLLKSSIHDYTSYYQDMLKRYPNYVLPVPDDVTPMQDSFIRRQIAEFPMKLQPFMGPSLLPPFLEESIECFDKYSYKSLPDEQLTRLDKGQDGPKETEIMARIRVLYNFLYPNLTAHLSILLRLLYNIVLAGFDSPLSQSQSQANTRSGTQSNTSMPRQGQTQEQETLENADLIKHKQVTCKAISGILILLLQITKIHHILEFEHVCSVLADVNCQLIFLKLLVAWFPSNNTKASQAESENTIFRATLSGDAWLRARDEPDELNFFIYCHKPNLYSSDTRKVAQVAQVHEREVKEEKEERASPTETSSSISTKSSSSHPGSFRNFYTTVNVLKILQKVSKGQYCRLLHLIQLKTCNIFKRICKIHVPDLQYYTLKLLYSQIPFLGRKWKVSNMSLITLIYMQLKPKLRQDYLSGDFEISPSEAAKQETTLRSKIREYHEKYYSNHVADSTPQDALDLILNLFESGIFDFKNPLHSKLLEPIPFHMTESLCDDE